MRHIQKQVEEFITVVKQEHLGDYPGRWMGEKSRELCIKLLKEEFKEMMDAIEVDDWPEIIDGAADTIFVILYMMAKTGIKLDPFWQEVCETNMAKAGGPKDPVTGKQLKPDGWRPPDIKKILDDMRRIDSPTGRLGNIHSIDYINELKLEIIDTEKNEKP